MDARNGAVEAQKGAVEDCRKVVANLHHYDEDSDPHRFEADPQYWFQYQAKLVSTFNP